MKNTNKWFRSKSQDSNKTRVMGKDKSAAKDGAMLSGKVKLFGKEFEKRNVVGAGLGILCAVALVGGGVYYALDASAAQKAAQPVQESISTSVDDSTSQAQEEYVVRVGATADGWDESSSSPVIVHVTNDDQTVDYYHAYDANTDAELAVPSEGSYTVSFISPVNSDGSIYRVPDATKVAAANATTDGEGDDSSSSASTALPFEFQKVNAEDVTADDLTNIIGQVTDAIKKGDDSLTGDNGVKVAEKVKENSKAAPNADQSAVEEKAAEATEAARATTPSSAVGTGSTSSSTPAATSSDSSSSSSSGSASSSDSGSGASSDSSSSQPAHVHDWVAQTEVVHHDAVYKTDTVHHDAVTHTIHHDAEYSERSICNQCGEDITGHTSEHMKKSALNGGSCQSYSEKMVKTKAAWDETVVDSAAYDEPVQTLVSAAWDETVVTGYKCSTCGATK